MTSVAQPVSNRDQGWRVIVVSGLKLGGVTAVGVVAFALVTRATAGTVETVAQGLLVLIGGAVASYLPTLFLRPTDVDSIAWVAMIGLLGALGFTVVDTVLLRPIDLYHWRWDAIGGGSGFWYIPVWWMGSAVLAWLGGWAVANGGEGASVGGTAGFTVVASLVMAGILILTGIVPFHAGSVALGYALGLVLTVPLTARLRRAG